MKVNREGLAKLGASVRGKLEQFIRDKSVVEKQMLKNLRQYLGQYDPEVERLIPEERSHVYPRDTRIKVKGGVAKMMEMMFPAQENNWELAPSPVPSVPKEALQAIISRLTEQEALAAEQEQRQPAQVSSEAIEREVRAFADARRDRMQAEIADQLADPWTDYPQMCKRVVRSGFIYGWGVVRSPMVRTQKERVWEINEFTGEYEAKEKTLKRPYPEYVKAWDFYPDLSARLWEDQERCFERFVFHRHDFAKLKEREDFFKDVLQDYLRNNQSGNYRPKDYETDLQQIAGTANMSERDARRYEVYRHLGFVSAHDLSAAGVEIAESQMDQDVLADIWLVDDTVIKAEIAAFGERPCGHGGQYHAFIYAEDEDSGLTGVGLPQEVRDSQMSKCVTRRALMDNIASVAGPIYEVNTDLLAKGRKSIGAIRSFMVIEREGEGATAQAPAVRPLYNPSHIGELIEVDKVVTAQLDIESNLPAWTFGAVEKLGEGVRTSFNMSQMTGGANMVTKDTVRAFDRFTTSIIGSMLMWNMEFNPNEEIKGDYQVRAKGNMSLVAREVRGAALDQFMLTLTPEERAILDTHGVLIDRLKARDLPVDRVLPREEALQVLDGLRQQASQAAQVEQGLTQAKTEDIIAAAEKKKIDAQIAASSADAVIQEILSRVESNMALAKSSADKTQLENLKTLLEAAA